MCIFQVSHTYALKRVNGAYLDEARMNLNFKCRNCDTVSQFVKRFQRQDKLEAKDKTKIEIHVLHQTTIQIFV